MRTVTARKEHGMGLSEVEEGKEDYGSVSRKEMDEEEEKREEK